MTRMTILGLLSILVVTSTLSPAYAEIMSPYYQANSGVENSMIQCNSDKVLVESPSGKPACVKENTAKKLESRGWSSIVLQETMDKSNLVEDDIAFADTVDLTSNTDDFISNDRIIESSNDFPVVSNPAPVEYGLPTVIFDYPKQMRIGEINTIRLNYTFAEIDNDTGELDKIDRLPDSFETKVGISFPTGIEILNEDYETRLLHTVAPDTPYEYSVYRADKFVEINTSIWQQSEIQFRITEPLKDRADILNTFVHAVGIQRWLEDNNGVITVLDSMPSIPTGQGDTLKANDPYRSKGEVRLDDPENPSTPPMEPFAEYLREHIQPIANVTQWLLDNTDYPQEYFDELFEAYPDLLDSHIEYGLRCEGLGFEHVSYSTIEPLSHSITNGKFLEFCAEPYYNWYYVYLETDGPGTLTIEIPKEKVDLKQFDYKTCAYLQDLHTDPKLRYNEITVKQLSQTEYSRTLEFAFDQAVNRIDYFGPYGIFDGVDYSDPNACIKEYEQNNHDPAKILPRLEPKEDPPNDCFQGNTREVRTIEDENGQYDAVMLGDIILDLNYNITSGQVDKICKKASPDVSDEGVLYTRGDRIMISLTDVTSHGTLTIEVPWDAFTPNRIIEVDDNIRLSGSGSYCNGENTFQIVARNTEYQTFQIPINPNSSMIDLKIDQNSGTKVDFPDLIDAIKPSNNEEFKSIYLDDEEHIAIEPFDKRINGNFVELCPIKEIDKK